MANQNIGFVICEGINDDTAVLDSKVIKEENGKVIAEGTLQTANETNRNARIYDRKDLFPELSGPRLLELMKAKQMKGESGHPMSADIARQQTILPEKTCVRYTKIWTEGDNIKSWFKGTNNMLGNDFDADLREECLPAFSLRALGTIENQGGKAYVKNIKIITWDHVIYPSHPHAYTERLVTESANINENNDLFANNGKGVIIPITNQEIVNYIKTESANIKTIINNFDTLFESIQLINNNKSVQLIDRASNVLIVPLENYIGDEIRNYCSDMRV